MTALGGPHRSLTFTELIAKRFSEPAFWAIQAMVLGISLLHIALEAGWISLGEAASGAGVHHLPVVLYLVPVSFASLKYGLEGGVLTSVWSGLLASVNVILFSLQDYEWVTDLGFVVLVVGVGIVTAFPVERERQQRHRAEAAVRRLQTLNELAEISLPARTPAEAVETVLDGLVAALPGLNGGGFVLRGKDHGRIAVEIYRGSSTGLEDLEDTANHALPPTRDDVSIRYAPVEAGDLEGLIAVSASSPLTDPELTSFLAAVGNQLATRVENALLVEQEQAAWSTYVGLVTEAQEEERKRLARELHDGPAQHLAMLVRTLEGRPELHHDASNILSELRRVARDQRPTLLDDLGVVPALEWLVAEGRRQNEGDIDLRVEGTIARLAPESEVALYRIAQEAIRNAETHGHPARIQVALRFGADAVELSVSDDGSGFEVPARPGGYLAAGRLGVMGMHERAQLVGGSLTIRSTPGSGTEVLAEVPTTLVPPAPDQNRPMPETTASGNGSTPAPTTPDS